MSAEHPTEEDALLTLAQIAQRFRVSRTTLHTLRARGAFPAPELTPGSTRLRWRESVVAAYFAANPKRQGARTDLQRKSSRKESTDGGGEP